MLMVSASVAFSASCGQAEDANPAIDTGNLDSSAARGAIVAAESAATALDEWNRAEVVKRLSEAGLVVSDRGEEIRQPFLSVPGNLLEVSESPLQLFIYPSIESREVDSQKLEPARAAPPNVMVSWLQPPHLIVSGKLLAILLTHNEHLAERVTDVLTARHSGVRP
ncbi:MAG: hypothetical protein ACR2G6_13635 [Gemmatimonadaceae bacterium]